MKRIYNPVTGKYYFVKERLSKCGIGGLWSGKMNRVAKGKRVEREVAKFFEELGYLAYRPTWSRWGQKDVFNKFDVVAIATERVKREAFSNAICPHFSKLPKIIFAQVKSNRTDYYRARKEIRDWLKKVLIQSDDSQVMVALVLREKKGAYRWNLWFEGREVEITPTA